MRSESLATRHILIMAGNYLSCFQLEEWTKVVFFFLKKSKEYTLTDTLA